VTWKAITPSARMWRRYTPSASRDEVHRNRIAGECVDHEHIEALRRLALETQARIAQCDLDGGVAVGEIAELAACDRRHSGIDVVEPVHVALRTPHGQRARTEADHTDAQRLETRMNRFEQTSDARGRGVIGRGLAAQLRREVLRPVQDRAV